MGIFDKAKDNTLTSAEVSSLWLQYMGDTMAICIYRYFLATVKDKEIQSILERSIQLSEQHVKEITGFLRQANFQIPIGFTEKDVNVHAPRLFSDQFILFYAYIMTIHGLTAYSLAITNTERQDIQDYFFECTKTSKTLFQSIRQAGKKHPKFKNVPSIPSPRTANFVESPGFVSNLIGDKRPLYSSEISTLFFNSMKTGFISSLSIAFSQVAEKEEVRNFMVKNVKLARKDAESFDVILQDDNLTIPEKWDIEITDSTISPFSDKLMMFHAGFLVNAALSYYGASIGSSFRSDITLNYSKVFVHAMEAGALSYNILVKNHWLEEQPQAIDRKMLAKGAKKGK
ncbi:DUF3231 family protein [Virgibacillus kimchii]